MYDSLPYDMSHFDFTELLLTTRNIKVAHILFLLYALNFRFVVNAYYTFDLQWVFRALVLPAYPKVQKLPKMTRFK